MSECSNIVFQIDPELSSGGPKHVNSDITETPETGSFTDWDDYNDGSLVSSPTSIQATKLENLWIGASIFEARAANLAVGQAHARVKPWCGTKYFSNLVKEGLAYLNSKNDEVIMVYECPSTSCNDTSFYNTSQYRIHDYPPAPFEYKAMLRPLRYASMNGDAYPSFLMAEPDQRLLAHWVKTIPNYVCPHFVSAITPTAKVYAYLPIENVPNHVIDPDVHYDLAGKRAINFMTDNAPRLLPNTKDVRPCVAKVSHAMGSLGIFIISNDEDEAEFEQFVRDTENPTFVITEFVDIKRNVSCHYFIHPNGEIIWFGSSENILLPSGKWDCDSTVDMNQQKELEGLQAPHAVEVAEYCRSRGYWGFCGIDVLFDPEGVGFVVDVNPRVTGTMPALMAAKQIQDKYGFTVGKMRRSSKCFFAGSTEKLFHEVDKYNVDHVGESLVVVFSIHEMNEEKTQINVGAYGNSHELCERLLDRFAQVV